MNTYQIFDAWNPRYWNLPIIRAKTKSAAIREYLKGTGIQVEPSGEKDVRFQVEPVTFHGGYPCPNGKRATWYKVIG